MAENIFSQILKDQLAKGQPIPAPQVRSVGIIPDARSPIGEITGKRLRGFNAQQMAGGTPYIRGARNIGPMPTTPDPRLPMRPLGSATPKAPRSSGGAMGALGLVELGLMGIDQIGRAINPDFARKRNIADEYTAKYGADYSLTPEEMAERLGKNDTTTYSSVPGFIGPVAQPSPGLIGPPVPVAESQKGAWTTKGWDPNASRTATPGSDVALPSPTFPGASPKDRAYVEEVSRLAQQAQTDPYFQQMQQYEAARKQAVGSGNQAQMDAVRDLGLAINAAKFGTPEQRMQQTVGRFNPQMAGMPGYPATREAFEQQRPFIAPEEEARIGAMDMASQALQGAMQGQAGTQFPAQALGVMQRPAGVSPNTSAFAGPQAGQAGMSMSPTTDISAIPEEAKAEYLKRLQSFRPM